MKSRVLSAVFVLLATTVAALAEVQQPKVRPAAISPGFRQLSTCILTMGERWAVPGKKPYGTIYGTYRGKPVFTEIMLRREDVLAGRSFDNVLRPLPGYRIDHVDINVLPHGHPGMPFPHYDVHGYYVSHVVHEHFDCVVVT